MASFTSVDRLTHQAPTVSCVVRISCCLLLSFSPDTPLVSVQGQTKDVLKKVDGLLEEAGTSKSNLLTANIWLKDIDRDFKKMNEVWSGWVDPENKPVRATVQSPMARPQILVEIQVTAAVETKE